jgi:hypothetical protein
MKPPRSLVRLFPQVTNCLDARTPVEITVKARDVARAEEGNPAACALALAACREYHVDHAVIGLSYSYIIKGSAALRFKTPVSIAREIVSFDRHGDFQPGTYALATVPPAQHLGQSATYRKKPGTKKPGSPNTATHRHTRNETLRVRSVR